MSRLKKLKINKNKNIKATLTGLSLSLVIGLAGGVGSYAYFTDKEEIKNDLVISMGDLQTSISKSLDITGLKPNSKNTEEFNIKNEGTLDQNVTIKFSNISQNIDYSKYTNSDKIQYELEIIKLDGNVTSKKTTINKLNELSFDDTELGTLKKGESFKCKVTISSGDIRLYENSEINFDLNVDAVQLGGGK